MIAESFKQDVLSRVDIVDVIDTRVPLKKAGANFSARCPFHTEKSPSFTVSPSKQFYHCFGCGAHGNAISFLMEYAGLGYIDAVRDLAESVGMQLPPMENAREPRVERAGPDLTELMLRAQVYFKDCLKENPRAIEYLKGRGLTGQIAARFGIGYAPDAWQGLEAVFVKHGLKYEDPALVECGLVIVNDEGRRYDRFRERIMFPILSQRGQVIGFGGRVLSSDQSPKYLNSPETPLFEKGRELYGLTQAREAIRTTGRAIVVEGYMDVVALAQYGVENAVATLGTATTPTHVLKLLRQTNEIVFCFDGDAAGRKAAWHALEVSLASVPDGKLIRFLFLPPEDDPDSFVRANGTEAFQQAANEAPPLSRYLVEELARRNPVDTAEGRSKILTDARPIVQSMSAPALKLQLMREIAAIAQVTPEELARLYIATTPSVPQGAAANPRSPPGAVPRRDDRAGTPSFRSPPPRTRAMDRGWLAAAGRLDRELVRAILVQPALAAEIPIELLSNTGTSAEALSALVDAVSELYTDAAHDPAHLMANLIERLRGEPAEILLVEMQADALAVERDPDEAAKTFRSTLIQLQIRQLQEDCKILIKKGNFGEMTGEEKARYAALIQRERELKEALRGSSAAARI